MNTFNIVFSKPTSTGNYFTKLQRKGAVSTAKGMFGDTTLESSETYFVFGSKLMPVNSQIQLDPSQWEIEKKPFTLPSGEVIDLKYLVRFKG